MKKVVMFAGPQHEIPPTRGAAVQTWIDEVSKRIISYQTHIISISHPFFPNKEFKDGVYYHRIHLSKAYKRIFQKILGWDIYSYNKRIFNIIKKIKPEIIHIHNYVGAKKIIKWVKNYNANIKIIFHMHNEDLSIKRDNFPEVDIFISCSNYLHNFYKNKINSNQKKVLYNGVDIKKYSLKESIKSTINQSLKKDKNDINICYFGRISPEKGVDKFVKLAYLLKNKKIFFFYCFGEISNMGDRKQYFKDIKEYIDKNKINNIKFLDYIPPQKIHLAYNYADIVVTPSKKEAFGMVHLEALASKKIVISSSNGGMVEFLDHTNSFIIKNYNNFEFEASHIINNLQKEDIELIQNNALRTAKNFDWVNIALDTERIYNDLFI